MKVILDVEEKRAPFFMELMNNLDFVTVVSMIHDKEKSKVIQDLAEAFEDVKLHIEGKKQLKSAKQLLDEL